MTDEIDRLRAKVERLESRGITDMQHRIAELEAALKLACRGDNSGLDPDYCERFYLAAAAKRIAQRRRLEANE
jgi:hypothetical protein